MKEKKPKANMWHIIWKTISVFTTQHCPRCQSKSPYYNDCPICEARVISDKSVSPLEIIVKYIAWLKDDN